MTSAQLSTAMEISRRFADIYKNAENANRSLNELFGVPLMFINQEEKKVVYECRRILEDVMNRSNAIAANGYAKDIIETNEKIK